MKTCLLSLVLVIGLLTSQTTFGQINSVKNNSEKTNDPKPAASPSPKTSPSPAPPAAMSFMEQPDYKAFMVAVRERDATKRVALVEKFLVDFPDSSSKSSANELLLSSLVEAFPNDKERIRAQAQKTIAGIREDSISYMGISMISRTYNMVISSLYKAGLNEDAQELAIKAFKKFDEANAKQLFAAKSPIWISMGQDALKKGDLKTAEKNFKQVLSGEYEGNAPLVGMAEIAEKRSKDKLQLDYLIQADARGSLKKDQRNKLEEVYLKVKGSKEGLREVLDENYRKANPLPVTVVKYVPTAKRTKRTVLAELFTGSACQPCITADLAFDALIQRYNPSEIAVLVYHLHIPGPDPMTNPATVARSRFYGGFGTPTFFINGTDKQTGGGINRRETNLIYGRITPKVDAALEKNQEADLNLSALLENQMIKANVNYDGLPDDLKDLKLNIALVEHEISYMGENGIRFHQMVVRELGGDKREGFLLKDKTGKVEWAFDLQKLTGELKEYLDKYELDTQKNRPDFTFSEKKHEINSKNLAVVAFIQNDKTKNILQSALFDLAPAKK